MWIIVLLNNTDQSKEGGECCVAWQSRSLWSRRRSECLIMVKVVKAWIRRSAKEEIAWRIPRRMVRKRKVVNLQNTKQGSFGACRHLLHGCFWRVGFYVLFLHRIGVEDHHKKKFARCTPADGVSNCCRYRDNRVSQLRLPSVMRNGIMLVMSPQPMVTIMGFITSGISMALILGMHIEDRRRQKTELAYQATDYGWQTDEPRSWYSPTLESSTEWRVLSGKEEVETPEVERLQEMKKKTVEETNQ